MKRKVFIMILVLSLLSIGCDINSHEYPNISKKPNINYYTSKLASDIETTDNYTVVLLETNLTKELAVNKEDKDTIINFFCSLEEENFIPNHDKPKSPPKFKFFIKLSGSRYIIDVYDEEIISIYPWDGIYSEDFITMKNIPKAYNLYGLSQYILQNY
ncbi:DUF4883 family protein [Clostridium polynesiense]|uniref:DUF4883 family protein n=1 Tax=Clostridium polynesiense TaxID=1325933 RepID=UPI000693F611|nr:DUF4883 family protein [Clostridium polynesiense]